MLLHSSENYGFSDENGIIAIFSLFCLFLSVPVMLLKEKACRKVWTGSKVYCSVHNYCSFFILLNWFIFFFKFFLYFLCFLSVQFCCQIKSHSEYWCSISYLSFIYPPDMHTKIISDPLPKYSPKHYTYSCKQSKTISCRINDTWCSWTLICIAITELIL